MIGTNLKGFVYPSQQAARHMASVAQAVIGTVGEVVAAALHLLDAEFTTGVVLPVDGGAATGRW